MKEFILKNRNNDKSTNETMLIMSSIFGFVNRGTGTIEQIFFCTTGIFVSKIG
jgi:hypothetical protein